MGGRAVTTVAASPPDKRQVHLRLGVLAYAGKTLPGTCLGFDAEWGTWAVKVLPRPRRNFAIRSWTAWRRLGIAASAGMFMVCGGGVLAWALLQRLADPAAGVDASSAPAGDVRPAPVDHPSWLTSVAMPPGVAEAFRLAVAASPVTAVADAPAAEPSFMPRRTRPTGTTARRVRAPVERTERAGTQGIREFTVPALPPSGDILLAVLDDVTVVVPNPLGVPTPVRVGQRLPSGAILLRVDPGGRAAVTDRGPMALQ